MCAAEHFLLGSHGLRWPEKAMLGDQLASRTRGLERAARSLIRLPPNGLFYYLNTHPLTLHSYYCLLSRYLNYLQKAQKQSKCIAIIKTWDGFLFAVRAWTSDLYIATIAERFELENWFKPLAKGTVVDVGAYIGTYTVRAMKTAEQVIAIEPLPTNFKVLSENIKLNSHVQKGEVILINKAIAKEKKETHIYVPIEDCIETARATLAAVPKGRHISYTVSTDTLDNLLKELGIEKVDLLKIDIEGYILESIPGMIETLKSTQWLFIELLGRDISAIRVLKNLNFSLRARHGYNFLFKNESI
jgi:FkbM family methyltransferase